METEGKGERRCQIHFDGNTDDIRRQVAGLNFLLIDGTENDGNTGKNPVAILECKIQRRGKAGNDQMDFPSRVFTLQELSLKLLVIASPASERRRGIRCGFRCGTGDLSRTWIEWL